MKIADVITNASGGIAELDGLIAAFDGKQTIRFYREQRTEQVRQHVYKPHFVAGYFEEVGQALHRDDLPLAEQLERYARPFAVVYSGYDGSNLAERAEYERGLALGALRTGGTPSSRHAFATIEDAIQYLADQWSIESYKPVDLDPIFATGAIGNPGERGWQWVIVPRNLAVDVMAEIECIDGTFTPKPSVGKSMGFGPH